MVECGVWMPSSERDDLDGGGTAGVTLERR